MAAEMGSGCDEHPFEFTKVFIPYPSPSLKMTYGWDLDDSPMLLVTASPARSIPIL